MEFLRHFLSRRHLSSNEKIVRSFQLVDQDSIQYRLRGVEVCLEGIGRLNQSLHQATMHTNSEGKLPKLFLFDDSISIVI